MAFIKQKLTRERLIFGGLQAISFHIKFNLQW